MQQFYAVAHQAGKCENLEEFALFTGIGEHTMRRALNGTAVTGKTVARAVFNYARKMDYTTVYPFSREKIKNTDIIHHDLTNKQITLLITATVPNHLRESIDACRLIFYLIGINEKDLYNLTPANIRHGRVEYIRAKTHKAYSIKIQPEAQALLNAYACDLRAFNVCARYGNHRNYLRRLNRDLCAFCRIIGIPTITTNWLRHSWATFAWRIGVPVDTISLALGHSFGLAVTNGYIQKDLRAADDANRLVLNTMAARGKIRRQHGANKKGGGKLPPI